MTAVGQALSLPLDTEGLRTFLRKLRTWEAFGGNANDVAEALDDVVPHAEHLEGLADLHRGHLLRLVSIAVAAGAEERDAAAARLIERARSEDLPGGHWKAVGPLRRMGWTVNELLERMVATGCVKAPDLLPSPAPGRGRAA